MKTEETIKIAIAKYEEELKKTKDRIIDINTWIESAEFMKSPDLFVAQIKEQRDELRALEKETDFKIRFAKWVLN